MTARPAPLLCRPSPRAGDVLAALGEVEVGDGAFEGFGGHADGLGQGGVGVDGEADVGGVGAHLDGQGGLGDQLAGVGADGGGADETVGGLVEQELGHALVAAKGEGAAAGRPWEGALAVLVAGGLGLLWAGFPVWAVCLVLYGAGVGVNSIARGTVPLALFGSDGYATLMGRLAMPMLLLSGA